MRDDAPPGVTDARLGQLARLAALLADGDVDGAIEAGLMDACVDGHAEADADLSAEIAAIADAQSRLQAAWAARDRYRARGARLVERENVRAAKRANASNTVIGKPRLPPAAAAALARARARAAGNP